MLLLMYVPKALIQKSAIDAQDRQQSQEFTFFLHHSISLFRWFIFPLAVILQLLSNKIEKRKAIVIPSHIAGKSSHSMI